MSFTSHTLQEEHQGKGADQADCDIGGYPENASIMELNDDCLRSVFSFLELHELLKMSFVCQRFFNIVEHEIRLSDPFQFIGMAEHFSLMEARGILSSFGDHIRRINIWEAGEKHRRCIELIGVYCRNLESIATYMLPSIDYETYKRIFQSNMGLTFLRLECCNINDEVCSLISELPELQSLDLSNNSKVTGLHLKKLRSLKELNLSDCWNLESNHFIDICQAIKLERLDIVNCLELNDYAFEALISTQTELESLAICNSCIATPQDQIIEKLNNLKHVRIYQTGPPFIYKDILCDLSPHRQEAIESLEMYGVEITEEKVNRERILKLVNLTSLYIVGDRSLDDKFLGEIGKSLENIELLCIASCPVLVTEIGITNLVSDLRYLQFLDVSFCSHVNYSLVSMIYKVLESSKSERVTPLEILALNTKISAEDLEGPDYQMHRKHLTVVLDTIGDYVDVVISYNENLSYIKGVSIPTFRQ